MSKRYENKISKPVLFRCPHCRFEQELPFNPVATKGHYGYVIRTGIKKMAEYHCVKCDKINL